MKVRRLPRRAARLVKPGLAIAGERGRYCMYCVVWPVNLTPSNPKQKRPSSNAR